MRGNQYGRNCKLNFKRRFPIACCVVMFINNGKFTETLCNLNVTLKELSTRMESLEEKMNK